MRNAGDAVRVEVRGDAVEVHPATIRLPAKIDAPTFAPEPGVSDGCQTGVRRVSDGCQMGVRWVSDGCQMGVRWVSDTVGIAVGIALSGSREAGRDAARAPLRSAVRDGRAGRCRRDR